MKVHDCEQGTTHWLDLRGGIPTSSRFSDIITPTGKPSASAVRYMHTLLAERLMGHPVAEYVSIHMDRGQRLEDQARAFYELQRDMTVETVGFITNDAETIGCSPDRLVGDDGLLEIKCPAEHTHVGYLLGKAVDKSYYPQIQGQLWISERSWVDIMSYHPEMPPAIVRVERDEKYIKALAGAVESFSLDLEDRWGKLESEYRPDDYTKWTLTTDESSLWLQPEDV